jgi:hypothetical protein
VSALSSSETETLREVRRVLKNIGTDGFDPAGDPSGERTEYMQAKLKHLDIEVHDIIQRKGYYPN